MFATELACCTKALEALSRLPRTTILARRSKVDTDDLLRIFTGLECSPYSTLILYSSLNEVMQLKRCRSGSRHNSISGCARQEKRPP